MLLIFKTLGTLIQSMVRRHQIRALFLLLNIQLGDLLGSFFAYLVRVQLVQQLECIWSNLKKIKVNMEKQLLWHLRVLQITL